MAVRNKDVYIINLAIYKQAFDKFIDDLTLDKWEIDW